MMTSSWSLPLRFASFLGWFIKQFVITSLQVSAMILTPGRQPRPGIVRVDLDELNDTELTLLVALITITPDTLVIALDREQRSMFVHGMFVSGDPEAFRSSILDTERRLVRGVRRRTSVSRPRKDRP